MKVAPETSLNGRSTRHSRRMNGGEYARELQLSMIHCIILFLHFFLVNTLFPILCRFTHVSFQALDFLYFIPLLNGNNITVKNTKYDNSNFEEIEYNLCQRN